MATYEMRSRDQLRSFAEVLRVAAGRLDAIEGDWQKAGSDALPVTAAGRMDQAMDYLPSFAKACDAALADWLLAKGRGETVAEHVAKVLASSTEPSVEIGKKNKISRTKKPHGNH